MRINLREILVLIFISIFVAISIPIIRFFFASNNLVWYIVFLIPFLFGICSAFIMYKGDRTNLFKKYVTQGLIVSVFIFIFTFYFSGTFFKSIGSFLEYIKADSKLAEACIISTDFRCKLLEAALLSTRMESQQINLSMLSLLGYLCGILIYSFLIQRFAER